MKILSICLYFFIFGTLIKSFRMRIPKQFKNTSHMNSPNRSIANNNLSNRSIANRSIPNYDLAHSNFISTFDSIEKSLNVSNEKSSICVSIPWNSTGRKCLAKNKDGCCISWQEPCTGKSCMIKCSFKLSDIVCVYG